MQKDILRIYTQREREKETEREMPRGMRRENSDKEKQILTENEREQMTKECQLFRKAFPFESGYVIY